MITKPEMFGLRCDLCQKDFQDGNGYVAMTDDGFFLQEAMESGWVEIYPRHYCDECHEYDDDDQLVLIESRRKEVSNG